MRRIGTRVVFGTICAMLIGGMALPVEAIWIEYHPGTCTVGPPPICVVGHWYWMEEPQVTSLVEPVFRDEPKEKREKRPSEVSTDLEYESFSYSGGNSGSNWGIRMAYERNMPLGVDYGLRGIYQRGTVEDEDITTQNLSATFYMRRPFYRRLKLVGSGTYSRYSAELGSDAEESLKSLNTFSGAIAVAFEEYAAPFMFSGGVSYQLSYDDRDLPEGSDYSNFNASLVIVAAAGMPLGDNMATNLEIYKASGFAVLGASLSMLVSETFALTGGYKTILGIANYSTNELTVGSSVRF